MPLLRRFVPCVVLLAATAAGCEGLFGEEEPAAFTIVVQEGAIVTEPFAIGDTVDGWVATLAGVRMAIPIRVRNGDNQAHWFVGCPRLGMRLEGGAVTLGTICANAGGTDVLLDPGDVVDETVVARACFGDDVAALAAGCSHYWTGPESLAGTYRAIVWTVNPLVVTTTVNLTAVLSGTFVMNN